MPRKDPETPWRNDSELALLRDDFYPTHTTPDPFSSSIKDRRHHAVDTVGVYVFRNPWTPHAVTATASLTEAILQYESQQRHKIISDKVLRSVYAMALVKFVNGFVDRDIAATNTDTLGRSEDTEMNEAENGDEVDSDESTRAETRMRVKGGGESSMYAFAAKIDMPEDFVNLRHSIVHGEIPSLATLDVYARKGLEWLWQKWWEKSATGDAAQAREEEADQFDAAELGRRRSVEAWQAYAETRAKDDDDLQLDSNARARRQWDDKRLKQVLPGIENTEAGNRPLQEYDDHLG